MENFVVANNTSMIYDEMKGSYIGRKKLSTYSRISNEMLMLFSNCLSFLNGWVTLDENGKAVVVYINGTNGKHLCKLFKLYDFITFHIYDDIEPCRELAESIRTEHNVVFFNNIPRPEEFKVKYESEQNVYLISEYTDPRIRFEPNYDNLTESEIIKEKENFHFMKEELIIIDSGKNLEFCQAVNAKVTMVKFRPPHVYLTKAQKEFKFFDGTILMPIFSDPKSVNCRMILNKYETIVTWNYVKFSGILNTWHYETKEKLGLNPFTGNPNPLPGQLGNQFEMCVLFSLIRDYYFTIGHAFASEGDVFNLYNEFLVDCECDNSEFEATCPA
jgi:hypothetical protein